MSEISWNRTDLIDESDEVVVHRTDKEKEKLKDDKGVLFEEYQQKRIQITKVEVNAEGAENIQKKEGTYITLTIPTLSVNDQDGQMQLEEALVDALKDIHPNLSLTPEEKILVIGLGNKTITPDAVGPQTIDVMQIENIERENQHFILFAPGVTAQTGFETSEFVFALAEKIQPKLVIILDALATKSSERLCKTVQITNTGIHPGSGVGNERKEISFESIGIPVTAIGIPTVVGGPVIVSDAIERVFRYIAAKIHERGKPSSRLSVTPFDPKDEKLDLSVTESVFGEWVNWDKAEREQLLLEVMSNQVDSLIVTPKEIDIWVNQYALLLTNALYKWEKMIH